MNKKTLRFSIALLIAVLMLVFSLAAPAKRFAFNKGILSFPKNVKLENTSETKVNVPSGFNHFQIFGGPKLENFESHSRASRWVNENIKELVRKDERQATYLIRENVKQIDKSFKDIEYVSLSVDGVLTGLTAKAYNKGNPGKFLHKFDILKEKNNIEVIKSLFLSIKTFAKIKDDGDKKFLEFSTEFQNIISSPVVVVFFNDKRKSFESAYEVSLENNLDRSTLEVVSNTLSNSGTSSSKSSISNSSVVLSSAPSSKSNNTSVTTITLTTSSGSTLSSQSSSKPIQSSTTSTSTTSSKSSNLSESAGNTSSANLTSSSPRSSTSSSRDCKPIEVKIQTATAQMESLTIQKNALDAKLKELKEALEELKKEYARIEDILAKLENQYSEVKKELDSLPSWDLFNRSILYAELKRLNTEMLKCLEQLNILSTKRWETELEIIRIDLEIFHLSQQISKLVIELLNLDLELYKCKNGY